MKFTVLKTIGAAVKSSLQGLKLTGRKHKTVDEAVLENPSPAVAEPVVVLPRIPAAPRLVKGDKHYSAKLDKLLFYTDNLQAEYKDVDMGLLKAVGHKYTGRWITKSDAENIEAFRLAQSEQNQQTADVWPPVAPKTKTPLVVVQTDLHRLVTMDSKSSLKASSSSDTTPTLSSASSSDSLASSASSDVVEAVTPPAGAAALPINKIERVPTLEL